MLVAEDVDRVERLLRDGMPQHLIAQRLGKPVRTVERYVARVHERWRASRLARGEHAVEERLEHHRRMAKLARKEGNWAASARYDREINLMLGVYAPEKHDHRAAVLVANAQAVQAPPQVDYPGMPDELLDAIEQALRAAQKTAAAVLSLPPSENAPEGPAASPGSVLEVDT